MSEFTLEPNEEPLIPITPKIAGAGASLLGWTMQVLAYEAGLSYTAMRTWRRRLTTHERANARNAGRIYRALANAGVEFIALDGVVIGCKLRNGSAVATNAVAESAEIRGSRGVI